MTDSEIRRFADGEALAKGAAQLFVRLSEQAIHDGGRFSVALSGGSTPKVMHRVLANEFADDVAWAKVHIFWGDERTVSPEHEDSNFRMAKQTLLDHVPIPAANIYRMQGELEPKAAANAYQDTLSEYFGGLVGKDWPEFDLIFLGIGEDGHTASLFPYTEALRVTDQWVVANHIPKMETWRITLTAPVINAAKTIAFLVAGESKAETLREVINGPYLPEQFPSQYIEPVSGRLLWMVDEAAASLV